MAAQRKGQATDSTGPGEQPADGARRAANLMVESPKRAQPPILPRRRSSQNSSGQAPPPARPPLEHTADARRARQSSPTGGSKPHKAPVVLAAGAASASAEVVEVVLPPMTQPSRRRRQIARTMRRFESAIGRLPGLKTQNRRNDARGLPGGPGGIGRALLGLALLLGLVAGFAYLHADDRWFVYREDVEIGGLTYLDADAIYAASGVDNWHRLWLRSAVIRQRLLDQPFVADASVSLSWPNHVTIQIVEQEPVALWVTSEATWWLMPNGEALPVHDDRFNHLPQIIDPQREARAVFSANRPAIMPHVLTGALALWANLPGIEQLRFNHDYGLNFSLPGLLTWVYWGDGQESERKFAQLAAVQQMIERGEARPQIIDLRFERAYFR